MALLDDLALLAQKRVGRSLRGKYLLERLIGVGGMAAVYEASHRNGMRVAVKVLHLEVVSDRQAKTRFLREGYVANRIGHPGVVRVLDDDEDADGTVFIAMDMLDGETLETEWTRSHEKLQVARVVAVCDELLDILDAAHAAGVVHRDLKPDNVFVTRAGPLKILDFGIARLVDQSSVTKSGEMMGTPEFVAPEQAGGRVREIGPRSDLFSLGAIMFTLLSGEYLHVAQTSPERMIYAATKPPRKIADVMPDVHSSIAEIIDRALAFAPEDRWASANAMRTALRSAAKHAGIALAPRLELVAEPMPASIEPQPAAPVAISTTSTRVDGSPRPQKKSD